MGQESKNSIFIDLNLIPLTITRNPNGRTGNIKEL
jgi:hypothetical protein